MKHQETILKLVIPKLQYAGWNLEKEIRSPYSIDKVYKLSGVIKLGNRVFPDLLLCYLGYILAVIEVKGSSDTELTGFDQANKNAKQIGVRFVISTNGEACVIFDMYSQRFIAYKSNEFPAPDELIYEFPQFMREAPALEPINFIENIKTVLRNERYLDEVVGLVSCPIKRTKGIVQNFRKKQIHSFTREFRNIAINSSRRLGFILESIEGLASYGDFQSVLEFVKKLKYPENDLIYLKFLNIACWANSNKFDYMVDAINKWSSSSCLPERFYNMIAEELIVCGNNALAYSYLQKMLEKNINDTWTKELMAIFHYNLRNYDSAAVLLYDAIKQEKNLEWIWLLGQSLFYQGKFEPAIKLFTNLLGQYPNLEEISKNICIIRDVNVALS